MKLYFKTRIPRPWRAVKELFTQELFHALIPPWADVAQERFDGCQEGDEIHISIKRLGLKIKWVSLITEDNETPNGWTFVDEGKVMPWPLTYWKHRHRVLRVNDSKCEIIDDIEYRCKTKLLERLIYPTLWSTIAIRPSRYRRYFKENR